MKPDLPFPIVSNGAFGRRVAELIAARAEPAAPEVAFHCASALGLGGLVAFAQGPAAGRPVVGVFHFERFLLVTPRLGGHAGPCARCYGARLMSHPPHPLNDYVVRLASHMCDANPEFEYAGWSEGMARISAALAWTQARHDAPGAGRALAMDIANLNVLSDPVVALHGCPCRDAYGGARAQGVARFTAFAAGLRSTLRPSAATLQEVTV